jgi:hypothetical protein
VENVQPRAQVSRQPLPVLLETEPDQRLDGIRPKIEDAASQILI